MPCDALPNFTVQSFQTATALAAVAAAILDVVAELFSTKLHDSAAKVPHAPFVQ
jgi:hypothetical protein